MTTYFHRLIIVSVLLAICQTALAHSGLYGVNTTKFSKDFSAAWLISKTRFINAEPSISTAVSMASATFSTIRQRCHNCKTLVTRDFFDFMVEHLSSATNQIPSADDELFGESIRRLQATSLVIKNHGRSQERDPRLDETIGLLVYSSICFSKHTQPIQRTIRPSFFTATFWSVHRYIKNIVIYVASEADYETVQSMDLPYALLTRLETPFDSKNRTSLLPRDSMLDLLHNMKGSEPFFKKFQYVFFSEGDQIVHMREPEVMYDVIDNSGGQFITVPHRMQSLTVKQDFPESLQHKWPNVHAQNIPDINIALQDIHHTQGSCCNSGDIEVAPCPGWWYQCANYGIRDFKTWLKFGDTGLTMPPVTEHKATCEYSPERVMCPLPKTCNQRIPTRSMPHTPLTERDVCNEIVNTVYLGFEGIPSKTFGVPKPSEPKVVNTQSNNPDLMHRTHLIPVVRTPPPPSTTEVSSAYNVATIVASTSEDTIGNGLGVNRKRKNRLRRRNRRIDTVTITGKDKLKGATGLRVVSVDDIQLA